MTFTTSSAVPGGSFEVVNLITCRHWSEMCSISYFLANLVTCSSWRFCVLLEHADFTSNWLLLHRTIILRCEHCRIAKAPCRIRILSGGGARRCIPYRLESLIDALDISPSPAPRDKATNKELIQGLLSLLLRRCPRPHFFNMGGSKVVMSYCCIATNQYSSWNRTLM
jgi:hypothetical protein